jgi:hypothetical protein
LHRYIERRQPGYIYTNTIGCENPDHAVERTQGTAPGKPKKVNLKCGQQECKNNAEVGDGGRLLGRPLHWMAPLILWRHFDQRSGPASSRKIMGDLIAGLILLYQFALSL